MKKWGEGASLIRGSWKSRESSNSTDKMDIENDDENDSDDDDEGVENGTADGGLVHKHFKWQPRFTDVYKSVDDAPIGNDGWAVMEGNTRFVPSRPQPKSPVYKINPADMLPNTTTASLRSRRISSMQPSIYTPRS